MKKCMVILAISWFLFLSSTHALAQGSQPTIPPPPTNGSVVLDTLDWLDSLQESHINTINHQLDQDGIAQIAVVTLNDCGEDPQRFRNELFRTWGIGHADDNDGLLILVCWYDGEPSLRTLEQETGYGLEGVLPDILTGRVADDYFIPAFQEDRPGEGLLAMVQQYDSILRGSGETKSPQPAPVSNVDSGIGWLITGILGLFPGYVLAKAYTLMAYPRAPRRGANPWDEAHLGPPAIRRNQFVIAEAISLVPILAVLFVIQQLSILSATLQEYGQFILPKLAMWLVFLLIYLINSSNYRRGGWYSGGDYWGRGTGGFGGFPDSGSDSGGFGGGDSGGGGSSTKF